MVLTGNRVTSGRVQRTRAGQVDILEVGDRIDGPFKVGNRSIRGTKRRLRVTVQWEQMVPASSPTQSSQAKTEPAAADSVGVKSESSEQPSKKRKLETAQPEWKQREETWTVGEDSAAMLKVVIRGDVHGSLDAPGASEVYIKGDVKGGVKTMSGSVKVEGAVGGTVSTMSGGVTVTGSVEGNVSTMSGHISRGVRKV